MIFMIFHDFLPKNHWFWWKKCLKNHEKISCSLCHLHPVHWCTEWHYCNTLSFDFLARKNVHYGLCEGFLKLWCLFVLSGRESVFKVYLDSFSWKFIISTKNVTLQNTCKPSTDAMSDSDTLPFDFLVRNDVPYGLPEGFIFYIYFSSHAAEKVILSCIFDVSHQKICLKTRILPENHQKKYF